MICDEYYVTIIPKLLRGGNDLRPVIGTGDQTASELDMVGESAQRRRADQTQYHGNTHKAPSLKPVDCDSIVHKELMDRSTERSTM